MISSSLKTVAVVAALTATAGMALAQQSAPAASAVPQNVLQLTGSGAVEVTQDVLVVRLEAVREAADAATVQTQLKQVLDAALSDAKRHAAPQQMEVQTGSFAMLPQRNKDGKISGWQGRAELLLQGKDFQRITTTAGELKGLSIGQVGFDLSREARLRVEAEAQSKAVEDFKTRASTLTKSFGFAGYTLREVSVNASNSQMPMVRMMARGNSMDMLSKGASAPVPVEAGKTQVEVSVSGSVQMR